MAGAKPAIPVPYWITRFLPQWNAAQMRANAYQDQPLRALRAYFVSLRIPQVCVFDGSGLSDLCFISVINEDRS